MDEVFGMSKLIAEYGIIVVLVAAYIHQNVKQHKYVVDNNRRYNSLIEENHNLYNSFVENVNNTLNGRINENFEMIKNIDNTLSILSKSLMGNLYTQIRIIVYISLSFNKHQVCMLIADKKESNNLDRKDFVENEVRMILDNLFNRFSLDLDEFVYKGHHLSYYINSDWIDRIFAYCRDAIFDGEAYHRNNYLPKLNNFYDDFENEFDMNLRKK